MKSTARWDKSPIEAIVIIGSILLAFSIDAWWQARQERELEQLYLQRLLGDLELNRVSAIQSNKAQSAVLEASRRTFKRVETGTVLQGGRVRGHS
jgi:hypothetical protein